MAAASSATGASTAHSIALQNHVSSKIQRDPISRYFPISPHAKNPRRRLLVIRSSSEEGATATEQEAEPPAELPKGPPSLISALNVEKALRGVAITDIDHYGRLGLRAGCSYDEVSVAFNSKAAEVMNKGLDEEEVSKELELLKESHSILSTVEERRMYDWSLTRSENPDKYTWPFEVDITQAHLGDPPPREPEDEGPTRLTGYFFISWLILSFALLIAFNR